MLTESDHLWLHNLLKNYFPLELVSRRTHCCANKASTNPFSLPSTMAYAYPCDDDMELDLSMVATLSDDEEEFRQQAANFVLSTKEVIICFLNSRQVYT